MSTEAERRVIEAAKAWRNEFTADTPWEPARKLCDAVDALTASQPVTPDQLKPGTLFKFAEDTVGRQDQSIFRMLHVENSDERLFISVEGCEVCRFMGGSLVIPIAEEEEGADLSAAPKGPEIEAMFEDVKRKYIPGEEDVAEDFRPD